MFQSEVKDQCYTLIELVMAGIGEPSEIEKFIDKQLWNYTYTYPNALGVMIHPNFSHPSLSPLQPHPLLHQHHQPYTQFQFSQ